MKVINTFFILILSYIQCKSNNRFLLDIESDNPTTKPTKPTKIDKTQCLKSNCPLDFGNCLRNICFCNRGYITINDPQLEDTFCNYEQKSQMKYFLLEFFISCGVGHFYADNYMAGFAKLLICSIYLFLVMFSNLINRRCKQYRFKKYLPYLQTLFTVVFCIFQIYDLLMIGLDKYDDGKHVELMKW